MCVCGRGGNVKETGSCTSPSLSNLRLMVGAPFKALLPLTAALRQPFKALHTY